MKEPMREEWGGDPEKGNFPSEPMNSSSDNNDPNVWLEDNHLFLYDKINKESALAFNRKLSYVDRNNRANQEKFSSDGLDPIWIKINSPGGLISSGVSMMDHVINAKSPVYTVVEGLCASAGTFISVVGDKRIITPHSYMLVHQLSTWFKGKYEELEDKKKNMDWLMEMIEGVYEEYTDFDMDELKELLEHDLYLSAKDCKDQGLVDKIQ